MTQLLARRLKRAGHDVRVIGIYPPDYPAPNHHDDAGVEVTRLREGTGTAAWVRARAQLFRHISRWAREGRIDLVEVPDWRGWAAGWPRLPVPVVARLNGSATYFAAEAGGAPDRVTRLLDRLSLRRADAVCSASRYTAERTQALIPLRRPIVSVLHNPIELPPLAEGARRDRLTVVFTGTLVAKKGVISLVRAWEEVVAHEPEARLHLYGKDTAGHHGPSMQAHLLAGASEACRASVQFHGHVHREAALAALRHATVAVFPSYAEAFAFAPLESMAQGCPTVYSTRGSGTELIRDGRDGVLVDPDRPAEIAAAVLRLLRDPALARRLGAAGYARVAQEFSLEVLLDRNVTFYRGCLAAFRGST
jgi:glycosyltransferase involved in cell wall biosynthesis